MRYDRESLIQFPLAEASRLWKELEQEGIGFIKYGNVNPECQDRRQNWLVPAKVGLPQDCRCAMGVIVFRQSGYLNRSKSGFSPKSRAVKKRLLDYCQQKNIPVLQVSRKWSTDEMRFAIRKWIVQLRKEA